MDCFPILAIRLNHPKPDHYSYRIIAPSCGPVPLAPCHHSPLSFSRTASTLVFFSTILPAGSMR